MDDDDARCKHCQGNEFEEEEGSTVCTTCGVILDNKTVLRDDPLQQLTCKSIAQRIDYRKLPRSVKYSRESIAAGKKAGIEAVKMLAANYKFNQSMKDELLSLFEKVIENEKYKNTLRTTKRVVAAVCAFLMMVRNGGNVSIQHICGMIGCDRNKFGHHYNQLKPMLFPHDSCSQSIVDLIPSTLGEANFDETEREKINRCVSEIIKLEKEFLTVEGRSPVYIIIAASFVAWKSINPRERMKFNCSKYCRKTNLKYSSHLLLRLAELNKFLISVTAKIPWLRSSNVNKSNVCLYLSDILKYSNSWSYDLLCERLQIEKASERHQQTFPSNPNEPTAESYKRKVPESENLSDISDSEVTEYIRSDKEVKILKKLKKLVESKNKPN